MINSSIRLEWITRFFSKDIRGEQTELDAQ